MCAAVIRGKDRIFPKFTGEVAAHTEVPAGTGFIDVFASTIAPRDEVQCALIEVKTNAENASAGDTIRQLKWYLRQLVSKGQDARLILVVEDDGLTADGAELIMNEQIEILPIWYFTMSLAPEDALHARAMLTAPGGGTLNERDFMGRIYASSEYLAACARPDFL